MKFRSLLVAAVATGTLLTAAPAIAATPIITNQTNSGPAVYPSVDGYLDTVTFGWSLDQPVTALSLDVMDSTHTPVFHTDLDVSATHFVWNGLVTGGGSIAPDGTYYAKVTADNGTDPIDSNNGPLFTVSGKKLTQKSFTKQVTATGSMEFKIAGKCSQVRKPGLKLGTGSLGYYSNKTCTDANQDIAASFHMITLPAAFRPGTLRLSAYGVAVKAGSTMRMGFSGDEWPVKLGSTKGWHTGSWVPAARSVGSQNSLEWIALADKGNRYDIKNFKIEYKYTTLS
jgi:hypothetical protein